MPVYLKFVIYILASISYSYDHRCNFVGDIVVVVAVVEVVEVVAVVEVVVVVAVVEVAATAVVIVGELLVVRVV